MTMKTRIQRYINLIQLKQQLGIQKEYLKLIIFIFILNLIQIL